MKGGRVLEKGHWLKSGLLSMHWALKRPEASHSWSSAMKENSGDTLDVMSVPQHNKQRREHGSGGAGTAGDLIAKYCSFNYFIQFLALT